MLKSLAESCGWKVDIRIISVLGYWGILGLVRLGLGFFE